jgi:hypothetical protein
MQSKLDRLTNYVESRLEKASKQQTDVMLQMSEQIARAVVAAEPTAQSNRIEQMSGVRCNDDSTRRELHATIDKGKQSRQGSKQHLLVPRLSQPYPHLMCTS